jgi:outer membrane protein TolC
MKKAFIALVFVLIASSYIYAEKITAEIVESQTLQNNPSIAKAKYALYIAKEELYSSFSSFLPTIGFSVSLQQKDIGFYEQSDKINIEMKDKDYVIGKNKYEKKGDKQYLCGLDLKMSLFSGFSEYNKTRALSAKLKIAQEDYTRAVSNAVCEAHKAYVNLMHTYESIDLYKQIKDRRAENRDLVKLRYNSGSGDIGSLMRSKADFKVTEYELEKAQRAIETNSAALLVAIGRNDDMTILETDERVVVNKEIISKPDFDNLIIKIPDFLSAKYKLDYAKAENLVKNKEWLPSIDFTGQINRLRYDNNKFESGATWNTALNLKYLLFTGGKRFFDTKSSRAQEKIAAEDFRNKKNELKFSAIQYYNNWVNEYEFLTVGNFHLESCKLQADIAKKKYINGLVSYEDWYAIEDVYIKNQKNMLDCRAKAILSKISWIQFLGKVSMKDKEGK